MTQTPIDIRREFERSRKYRVSLAGADATLMRYLDFVERRLIHADCANRELRAALDDLIASGCDEVSLRAAQSVLAYLDGAAEGDSNANLD